MLDLSLKTTSGTADRPSSGPLDCIRRSRVVAAPARSTPLSTIVTGGSEQPLTPQPRSSMQFRSPIGQPGNCQLITDRAARVVRLTYEPLGGRTNT